MNKNSRKSIIVFLLVLSLVLTTGTFAYWASFVEGTTDEAVGTIAVGYGESVETRFELTNNINNDEYLVPQGQANNSQKGAVESISLIYGLAWKENSDLSQLVGATATGKVNVTYSMIIESDGEKLDEEEYSNIYNLINVNSDLSNPSELILDEESKLFSFYITMNEPKNQEEYTIISNATITITFSFSINDEAIDTVDGEVLALSPYGSTHQEIIPSIIADMQEKLALTGSYGRTWGNYRYTDLGLNPEDWAEAVNHIYYKPSGNVLRLRPEKGYEFTIYNSDNEEFTMKGSYNWNLIYNDLDGNWYFHVMTPENIVDINTLVVELS